MTITNKFNLPLPIYRALVQPSYSGDGEERDYSITELMKPAHQRRLEKLHWDECEQDISEQAWMLRGNAIHAQLARGNEGFNNVFVEKRFKVTYHDKVISGGIDLYYQDESNGEWVLCDWKTTSKWNVINQSRSKDWETQLNLYAWLMRGSGYAVDRLEIFAEMRDWQARDRYNADMPRSPYAYTSDIRIWSDSECEAFVTARIHAMENPPTECSPEERWESDAVWAVMKEGRKAAMKLFDNEEQALGSGLLKLPRHYIEERPQRRTRCDDYCLVTRWCESYQKYKGAMW